MEATLRRQLKRWQRDFRAQHNREPTKNDILRDEEAAAAYDTWRALGGEKRESSSKTRPTPQEVKPPPQADPLRSPRKDPGKRRPPHIPTSPSNPFRSPHRDSKRTAPRPLTSPGNPFRSPKKEQTHDSDMSSDDEPEQILQRGRLSAPVDEPEAPSAPVAVTPRKRTHTIAYTPRTKARRLLRGDDVQTPPKGSPRHKSILLSPKNVRSGLFRTNSGSVDEFGPSPRKRTDTQGQRGFLPLLRPPSVSSTQMDIEEAEVSDAGSPEERVRSPPAEQEEDPEPKFRPGPASDELEINGHRISVLPYRPFGSVRDSRACSDDDCVPEPAYPPEPEPQELHFDGLVLRSPVYQGARAAAQARARDDRVLHSLIEADDEPPEAFRRVGRAGLEVDEDEVRSDSEEWASEVSSADYGWGDGAMDEQDIE